MNVLTNVMASTLTRRGSLCTEVNTLPVYMLPSILHVAAISLTHSVPQSDAQALISAVVTKYL